MKDIEIKYKPSNLSYESFAKCNDLCFRDEPISKKEFEKYVKNDFWAIYDEQEIIGYCILTIWDEVGWIKRVAICPDFRRKGYASRLMELMFRHCRTNNCRKIGLSVQQDNPGALHLYGKYGFKVKSTSYQYIVDIDTINPINEHLKAIPITEYDNEELSEALKKWQKSHNPPEDYVLVFFDKGNSMLGFCRLNTSLPGCKPFEIYKNVNNIDALLLSLKAYLSPKKMKLKITFNDAVLEEKLRRNGYKENYRLHEMECLIEGDTVEPSFASFSK